LGLAVEVKAVGGDRRSAVAANAAGVVLKQKRQQQWGFEPRPSKYIEFPKE